MYDPDGENTISSRFLRFVRTKVVDVDPDETEEAAQEGFDVDPDDLPPVEIETFTAEPFYFSADEREGYRNNHYLQTQMSEDKKPTLASLVDTCRVERESENITFEQGMWVEYRSNNMEWKVGLVNRVIKQPPDSWDFDDGDPPEDKMEIYYNVGIEGLLSREEVRAPRLGLQFLFGKRPWLWQQFTILQLEKRLRFDPSHEFDFDEIDCHEFADDRFELWLNDPRNEDFKAVYDSETPIARFLLKDHLLTPFDLMDEICENEENWDFDDPDISVYTYLGVLGDGFIMSMVTFGIQVVSPLILFYNTMIVSDGEPNLRFFVNEPADNDNIVPSNGAFLPSTDFDTFCNTQNPREEGKAMIVVVLMVYAATVIPDGLLSFYRTSGGAASTYSKINSLRQIIWGQNDDSVTQQFGFKLDRLMNTGYVAILYFMMLFILIQTPIVLDLILNALAIEFIHEIDERIANSDWYDEGNRWIRAGTLEMVMQGVLRLRVLERPNQLCKFFDIDRDEYKDALGGKALPLHDSVVAFNDDHNQKYMTKKERVYYIVAKEMKVKKNKYAYYEYYKQIRQFSWASGLTYLLGLRTSGMFHRYADYRVWSRWEKVLFLPKVPDLKDEKTSARLAVKTTVKVKVGKRDLTEFLEHILLVLSGVDMVSSMWQAGSHGYIEQIPLKFLLGLAEIVFYLLLLIFPVAVLFGLVLVPYCY